MPEIKCQSCNAIHNVGFRELVDRKQVLTVRIGSKPGSMIRSEVFADAINAATLAAQSISKEQGVPLAGYVAGATFGDGFAEVELAFLEMATEGDVKNSVQPNDGG